MVKKKSKVGRRRHYVHHKHYEESHYPTYRNAIYPDWPLAILRIFLGFIFFWAFLDKLLGLGFPTTSENAWTNGGSPTLNFLTNSVQGPLASFFNNLAGIPFVDLLFMIVLLVVGVCLIVGIYTKIGSVIGIIIMSLIYLSRLPPVNNPVIDQHIIYIVALFFVVFYKDRFRLEYSWR